MVAFYWNRWPILGLILKDCAITQVWSINNNSDLVDSDIVINNHNAFEIAI